MCEFQRNSGSCLGSSWIWEAQQQPRPRANLFISGLQQCFHQLFNLNKQHHSFSSHYSAFLVFFLRISLPWNVSPVAVGSWVEGRRVSRVQGSHCFAWVNEAPHSVLEESNSVTCVVSLYGTSASLTWEKTVKILQPVNGPEESFLHSTLGRWKMIYWWDWEVVIGLINWSLDWIL